MAKLWQSNPGFWAKMAAARQAKKDAVQAPIISDSIAPIVVPTEAPIEVVTSVQWVPQKVTIPSEPVPAQQPDLRAILDMIERQAEEIKLLKSESKNPHADKKEKYKWPRNYAFSLWGGVPVLKRTSFKKDRTKDLLFQNEFKVWISNQYMKLELADGTTADVEVNEYNRSKEKTQPMPCAINTNEYWETSYVFTTQEYWKITILSSYIN